MLTMYMSGAFWLIHRFISIHAQVNAKALAASRATGMLWCRIVLQNSDGL
jgi:hypothetical protein